MASSNALVSVFRRAGMALALTALAALPFGASAHDDRDNKSGKDWPMFGQNLQNTAAVRSGDLKDVAKLKPKWTFTAGGDISARAAVVDGRAYFPDWAGNIWAVNTKNGSKAWGRQLSDYGLPGGTKSRTTPAVDDGIVYIATQQGGWLLALHAHTGHLLWKTQLVLPAEDPWVMITSSPTVSGNQLFIGTASAEEGNAGFIPNFACCKARGSVVAVDIKGANRGKISWRTFMTPPGYSGAGVWSSNFVVDEDRGLVFVSTGNNYAVPSDPAYHGCLAAGGTAASCNSPDNHVDAIVALKTRTGKIHWAKRFVEWQQPGIKDGADSWNVACFFALPGSGNCPAGAGPDYDFASAPNLITFRTQKGHRKTILGAGQKSGIYFAMDPDTGQPIWQTQVGPGSTLGGMEWGSATDGKRIYVAIANLFGIPTGTAGGAGSWSALDPETGKIIWQVGDPNGALALGALAVVDGVVFAPSMAGAPTAPNMLALSAETGQTLWSFAAGASVVAGAAIVDGVVYWGSGYSVLGLPGQTAGNTFYAFSKHGR